MASDAATITPPMRALHWRTLWRAYARTPWSFRLLCVYMFFEYVRPQSIYTVIAGPPYSLISIVGAFVAMLAEGRRPQLPVPLAISVGVFSAVMVSSALAAVYPAAAVAELQLYGNWLLLILIISGSVTNERKWFLFLVAFLLFSLKMSQHGFLSWVKRGFAFTTWGVTGGPGWFQNSGEFALQMGIFVPLSVSTYFALRESFPRWLRTAWWFLPVSAVGSIIASSSRGGLLAVIVIAFVAVLRTKYRIRALAALIVGLPLMWLIVPEGFRARFDTAGSDVTSQARLRFWKNGMAMASERPALGVGPGNWIPYYREHFLVPGDTLNRFDDQGRLLVQPAHNSFVEIASQLGYTGLLSFLLVLGSVFLVNARTRRIASRIGPPGELLRRTASSLDDGVIVFCVAGFFMSVALYPFIWVQVAMTAAVHTATIELRRRSTAGSPMQRTVPVATSRPHRRGFRGGAVAASAPIISSSTAPQTR